MKVNEVIKLQNDKTSTIKVPHFTHALFLCLVKSFNNLCDEPIKIIT